MQICVGGYSFLHHCGNNKKNNWNYDLVLQSLTQLQFSILSVELCDCLPAFISFDFILIYDIYLLLKKMNIKCLQDRNMCRTRTFFCTHFWSNIVRTSWWQLSDACESDVTIHPVIPSPGNNNKRDRICTIRNTLSKPFPIFALFEYYALL